MDQRSNGKKAKRHHSRKSAKLLLGITAIALTTAPLAALPGKNIASAATASSIPAGMATLAKFIKPIYVNSTSYINLVDASLAPADNGQVAAFTLSVYNGGSSELDLMDYWFRLSNSVGGTYSIKTSAADSKVTKIASKTKAFITIYAQVGENTTLSDLTLKIVKFDFSTSNYEKSVGTFTFPSNFNNVVPTGSYKPNYFNNTMLYSKISSASMSQSGDDTYATIDFVYNNIGKKSVTLSKYKYYIVTASGETYEATPEDTSDLVMDPLQRTELQLTATIPSSIKTTGWKLVVVKDDGEDAGTLLPVGAYQIGFNGKTVSNDSKSFTYTTSDGTYGFDLTNLERQPWDSQDVLSAKVRITNKSTSSVPIPTITGYFYLDDKVKLDFKTVATNNPFGLNAGASVDLDVYAKLPSNYDFSKATLVINDQKDENTSTQAGELTGTTAQTAIPIYAVDSAYRIGRTGSQMTAKLNAVNIYEASTSKVFDVQVDLQNNETRSLDPSKLVGFFVNDNGDTFPATVNTGDGLINPSGKSLATFSTVLPEDYQTGNLRLILGEGVTDSQYSAGTDVPNAYLNSVKYNLPIEQRSQSTMNEMPFLNYKLTINKFTPNVMTPTLNLDLDYTLEKDMTYNAIPKDYKLMLNIEGYDPTDGKTYTYSSQDLDIDGDADTSLKPGTDNEVTLSKDMNYDTVNGNLIFYARVYEVTQNSKKLVAEHQFNWYIPNDWTAENAAASTSSPNSTDSSGSDTAN